MQRAFTIRGIGGAPPRGRLWCGADTLVEVGKCRVGVKACRWDYFLGTCNVPLREAAGRGAAAILAVTLRNRQDVQQLGEAPKGVRPTIWPDPAAGGARWEKIWRGWPQKGRSMLRLYADQIGSGDRCGVGVLNWYRVAQTGA